MVVIREYMSNDFNGLIQLLKNVYGSAIQQDVLEKNYLGPDKKILVAIDEQGKLIGDVFLEKQYDYIRPSQILYVTYLAVDQGSRCTGVGRKLMDTVESLCKEMNCTSVEFTSADFRNGAHAFYSAIGYTKKKTTHFIKEA